MTTIHFRGKLVESVSFRFRNLLTLVLAFDLVTTTSFTSTFSFTFSVYTTTLTPLLAFSSINCPIPFCVLHWSVTSFNGKAAIHFWSKLVERVASVLRHL